MAFRSVFIAVVLGFALVIAAFLLNRQRPKIETEQPNAALVRASGKCAECHYSQQYSVVHEYEMSMHARKGVNCLECHQPAAEQAEQRPSRVCDRDASDCGNCRSCHETIYHQISCEAGTRQSRGRRCIGEKGFAAEQVAFAETISAGICETSAPSVRTHGGRVGDGERVRAVPRRGKAERGWNIGTCTACHTRHTSSVELSRLAADLRPVPHGTRSFPDRDLRRIKHGVTVQRAVGN